MVSRTKCNCECRISLQDALKDYLTVRYNIFPLKKICLHYTYISITTFQIVYELQENCISTQ